MNRREFIRSALCTAVCLTIPSTLASNSNIIYHNIDTVSFGKLMKERLGGGVIEIYSGACPETPYDEWPDRKVATITLT